MTSSVVHQGETHGKYTNGQLTGNSPDVAHADIPGKAFGPVATTGRRAFSLPQVPVITMADMEEAFWGTKR